MASPRQRTAEMRATLRTPPLVNLEAPDPRQRSGGRRTPGDAAQKTGTPLERDVDRRMALIQKLKILILDESEGMNEGLQCLNELFDASIGSDDICKILARDRRAIEVLDDLARQRANRFAPARVLALRILLNVSSVKEGALSVAAVGGLQTMLEQIRQLNVSATEEQLEMGNMALRSISNLLFCAQCSSGENISISKTVTIALTLSRKSEDVCDSACAVLANLAMSIDGASASVDANAHKALFSSLLPRNTTVKQFIKRFIDTEAPLRASMLQVQALWALRNISSFPIGRERLVADLPALVAIATTIFHSDTQVAVEHAVGLVANLVNTEYGRHLAVAASTCRFCSNLLEIGVFLADFKAANGVLCIITNLSKTAEGREQILDAGLMLPLVGLLKAPGQICQTDFVLSALVGVTAGDFGREVAVIKTDVERAAWDIFEKSDKLKVRMLALAVLRNTSGKIIAKTVCCEEGGVKSHT